MLDYMEQEGVVHEIGGPLEEVGSSIPPRFLP
jgi:hypothetical protein